MTEDTSAVAEPRARLAALFEKRADHLSRADRLRAKLSRLPAVADRESQIAGRLAALDAADAAGLSDWLDRDDDSPRPIADIDTRESLKADLAEATAIATASRAVQERLAREIATEERAAEAVSAAVNRAISEIIEGDIDALAAGFEAEKAKFIAAHARLEQAHRMFVVLSHSTPDGDDRKVMLSRIEGLGQKIKATLAAPNDSEAQASAYGAWSSYAARLQAGDTTAQLSN